MNVNYISKHLKGISAQAFTQVGLTCVNACIAKGLKVSWHCFDFAIGSIKIAEKIHLEKTDECPAYIVDIE